MKALLWIVGIFALAVGLVLAALYNDGFALVVMPPYRIEISLNLLIVLMVGGVAVVYSVLRLVYGAVRLPSRVHESRLARRRALARSGLLDAIEAWFRGGYAQAEQAAVRSLEAGEHPHLAAIVAARSAHALRAGARRDAYLKRLAESDPRGRALGAITAAELMLEEERATEALALLESLSEKDTAALKLELEARRRTGDWARLASLAGELERESILSAGEAQALRARAEAERLRAKRGEPQSLAQTWRELPEALRRNPEVAAAAARGLLDAGENDEARQAIEAALEERWSGELIALYGRCTGSETKRQIEQAQRWLARHPDDAALRLVLGELHAREGLWEEAARHLEASLAAGATCAAHLALARAKDAQGETEAASRHFDAARQLAFTEIADVLREARAAKPVEERGAPVSEPLPGDDDETPVSAAPVRVRAA
jgi:HemY protein